jgi:hypothetical protein
MSSKLNKKQTVARKSIEAVAYLFAVAADKSNPFIVTEEELFINYKVNQLGLEEDDVVEYLQILFEANALTEDEDLPNGSYRISYFYIINLIIFSLETSEKPHFLVLSGWENVVRQDSIPPSLKEFFIAYQSLNIQRYFHYRLIQTDNPNQVPVFNGMEN